MLPLINVLSTHAIAAYDVQSVADSEAEMVRVQPSTQVISVDSGATSSKQRKIIDFFPMQASTSVTPSQPQQYHAFLQPFEPTNGLHCPPVALESAE